MNGPAGLAIEKFYGIINLMKLIGVREIYSLGGGQCVGLVCG